MFRREHETNRRQPFPPAVSLHRVIPAVKNPVVLGNAPMKGSDKGYRYIILNGSWLDHLVTDHGQDRQQFRDSLTDSICILME